MAVNDVKENASAPGNESEENIKEQENKDTAKTETAEEKPLSGKEKKAEESKLKKENSALRAENEKLSGTLAETSDKYLRLVAEYDNFRKRTQKEKEAIYTDAYSDCVTQLLPIADNLERALLYPDGSKTYEGVKLTMNSLKEIFKKLGIEEIDEKNFDPNIHNAVMHIEDENYGENEVVEVLQKGYRRGDKVIRYAMVKVANAN